MDRILIVQLYLLIQAQHTVSTNIPRLQRKQEKKMLRLWGVSADSTDTDLTTYPKVTSGLKNELMVCNYTSKYSWSTPQWPLWGQKKVAGVERWLLQGSMGVIWQIVFFFLGGGGGSNWFLCPPPPPPPTIWFMSQVHAYCIPYW